MRIAVITDEKLSKSIAGSKLKIIPWDTEKLEAENLRDYDGIIVDCDSYDQLEKVFSPRIIEDDAITPKITYDVLKASPSFYIMLGDPSRVVQEKDLLGLTGFSGEYVKGSGTQHNLTEAGKQSVYKSYLSDIKRYKYAYGDSFETDIQIRGIVQNGLYNMYVTQTVPLMETKSGYLTAFQLQGYYTDHYNSIIDSSYLFSGGLPTFLPGHPEGLEKGLNILLRSIKESTTVDDAAEPDWLSLMTVQGQAEVDSRIESNTAQIETLTIQKREFEQERVKLRGILEILYLADKQLESALKQAMQSVGFTINDPVDNNNVEFYLRNGKQEFVVEVKSSLKPHFNKEGLRQVNEWRENEALESGKEYKPLLILSNEYDKPLGERNIEGVIDENLESYAVSRKIAVITTPILFQALQYASEGKITAIKLADVLFKAQGLLKIEDFYPGESK
jgi:hypothetical protein